MNENDQSAAVESPHNDIINNATSGVDNEELWLPNGTLFNDEAAERYGDVILERARIQLEQERLTHH